MSNTHTHTHTHTHTQTQIQTHACTHRHARSYTHTRARAHSHSLSLTHRHSYTCLKTHLWIDVKWKNNKYKHAEQMPISLTKDVHIIYLLLTPSEIDIETREKDKLTGRQTKRLRPRQTNRSKNKLQKLILKGQWLHWYPRCWAAKCQPHHVLTRWSLAGACHMCVGDVSFHLPLSAGLSALIPWSLNRWTAHCQLRGFTASQNPVHGNCKMASEDVIVSCKQAWKSGFLKISLWLVLHYFLICILVRINFHLNYSFWVVALMHWSLKGLGFFLV